MVEFRRPAATTNTTAGSQEYLPPTVARAFL
jgi:hypothetical protein